MVFIDYRCFSFIRCLFDHYNLKEDGLHLDIGQFGVGVKRKKQFIVQGEKFKDLETINERGHPFAFTAGTACLRR
jgi:hypothetical protein